MKTEKPKKTFDTVKTFRKIKDNISKDLTGMDFEQIKQYLKAGSLKLNTK
jgi:hypothetical protein